jgi:carboxyl-terminal processing protease
VQLRYFGQPVNDDLARVLLTVRAHGATGLVLDLRDNPGGIRDQAVAVASQFIGDGTVLVQEESDGHRTTFGALPGGAATDVPLVTLVNAASASSAEIVAGAIQDRRRGLLIGTTTSGAGTVLSSFGLRDGSVLLLATSRWLTPGGRSIWHSGITPDVNVALSPGSDALAPEEEAGLRPEQLNRDAQLARAVHELTRLSDASKP